MDVCRRDGERRYECQDDGFARSRELVPRVKINNLPSFNHTYILALQHDDG